MRSLAIVYLGLLIIAPLCALAQRLRPSATPAPRVLSRSRRVDWLYWIVTPLGTGFLTRAATLTFAAMVVLALGWGDLEALLDVFHARSPLPFARWPLWAQFPTAIVIADFVSYWSHRARHHARFFPLHAVHHSARELDWLAAARMHPLDDLVDNVAVTLPILLLGFDPVVFVAIGPALLLHTLYLHSAVQLSLGPLRYVIATPDFHRWHHAIEPEAQGSNYGGVLAIWDVMFGTFRMPRDRAPSAFGVEPPIDDSLRAQLVRPLERVIRA
ncbi:sterol desaturase family protein [Sandaracinus amylolyticus]|uniref:sterol desaturase family protein n=1 Tax=Sandaracinus amylolyticus TaxID=927083 RepID=UPI001F3E3771|nr:sterol desaturase family protein [Sandaracinus amylolyticus]UJR78367.1 Fatty acid hydroxylase [Sandaracinus amylolyticus]